MLPGLMEETGDIDPKDPTQGSLGAKKAPGRLRSLAPWLGALGIFAFLFWEVPIAEVGSAASNARLDLFLPEMIVAVVFWFLLDSRALAYVITRFNAPLAWGEARSMRGVTYMLTVLNWNVGTAAIVVYLKRFKSVPALESTSSLFLYGNCDALIMLGLALVGSSVFAATSTIETLRDVAGVTFSVQAILLLLLAASFPAWRWLGKVRSASIVRSYRLAKLKDFGFIVFIKLAYFLVFIWIFWAGSHAFGIEIPFLLALASAPVIMLVAAIPVTPAGLGTQAAAMVFFWSDYGDKAEILAFGLVFPVALTALRCLLGLVYVKDLLALRRSS